MILDNKNRDIALYNLLQVSLNGWQMKKNGIV